ncbi:cholinesterase 1-like [Ruditapes philippinarum]|uniref:cholinesterase 1-like n=1 Tax=Ruditapes philippinarum TaxID=129788 RepID=UPI00295B8B33|nr:cholinesterase 1-like [Ruditapes philippinarum]XP_060591179.1 cholinesterase 1-like [Ruditapes philippinarum]XP_060591181.1 cholinesterase 1-like [Ruditapes philippinarum]XP_060591182.1 cholinesterase 1-like [Ruditapes philippinarum]XP_060591183.1 cholinesterase 1-like [Ruditapes philippinarum]
MATKVLLLLPVVYVVLWVGETKTVSVSTKIGVINGQVEDVTFLDKSATIHTFLGIPFAEPPIGNLRFKKPLPKTPLKDPLNAFKHNNACLPGIKGLLESKRLKYDEDCLYLNIYAPELNEEEKPLAVMVWIYGGGFILGFSDMYLGHHLATHGRVIVVTLNYRLSVWGFLSTGDEHAPGNYGLWDQHLGIKWVHDNIAAFGGDPNRVTIFGESAGSASVFHQTLYPGNKGLFQRAIGQSGSVGNFWGLNEKNKENANKIGNLANCKTDGSESLVNCLRQVPVEELSDFVCNFKYGLLTYPFSFLPTHDGDFVKTDPKRVFDKDNDMPSEVADFFSSLDVMTGVTSGEGSIGITPFVTGITDAENFTTNKTFFVETLVPSTIGKVFGETVPKVAEHIVISEYTNWENPDDENNIREEFISMFGDVSFTKDLYVTLNAHSKLSTHQHTYMYLFEIVPEYSGFLQPPSWFKKFIHAGDLPFVFGFVNSDQLEDEFHAKPVKWEIQLSADVMTIWSNFAKTGNPNFPSDLGLDWIPYTRKHQHYLQISRDMTSANVKQRWNTRRANFLENILPRIVKAAQCNEQKYSENLNQETCDKDNSCSP